MRKVALIMGVPVSIDVPGVTNAQPLEAAFVLLRCIEEQFSPYKKHSELSRYQAGQLDKSSLSADMREIMLACDQLRERTRGYFSAYFDDRFDPTGYVKGWAIQRAGKLLERAGHHTYMINAGGDILTRSNGGHTWRIGLQHPTNSQAIMGTIAAADIAVATSGLYARGQHIIDPVSAKRATELISVTVIGPQIATADALATALFAMGYKGLDFIETQQGYDALLVGPELDAHMSSNFAKPARMQIAR